MAAGLLDLDDTSDEEDSDEEDDLRDSDQHAELVGWLVSMVGERNFEVTFGKHFTFWDGHFYRVLCVSLDTRGI